MSDYSAVITSRRAILRGMGRTLTAAVGSALSACSLPFADAGGTPLARVRENYISLIKGIPGFLGLNGSAVVLTPGIAVTNAHVATASDRYTGVSADGAAFEVTVLAISPRLDLALLGVPIWLGRGSGIATATVSTDEKVWAMGTTAGGLRPVAEGRVVNPDGRFCHGRYREDGGAAPVCEGREYRGLIVAADGGPGYSGGPLVNRQGALVGVTQGQYIDVRDVTGRRIETQERLLFAYRIADVLAEMRRLLETRMQISV